jgi:uncharacterized protein YcbX
LNQITVDRIIVYPIKSLAGVSVESAEVEPRGLRFDRRWMLVDSNGRFISQREFPALALTHVTIEPDGILVQAPGMPDLLVPYHLHSSDQVAVSVWNDNTSAYVVDTVSNSWFTDYLDTGVRLVVMSEEIRRPDKSHYLPNDSLSFADGYPLMLVGQNSLNDLNSRLETPVKMNRFRPNIVTIGNNAYSEDRWTEINIGAENLRVVSSCSRCVMTTIHQSTGVRGTEPLKTLATFRLVDQKIFFGRNLIPVSTGWIHIGDEVEVLKAAEGGDI